MVKRLQRDANHDKLWFKHANNVPHHDSLKSLLIKAWFIRHTHCDAINIHDVFFALFRMEIDFDLYRKWQDR